VIRERVSREIGGPRLNDCGFSSFGVVCCALATGA